MSYILLLSRPVLSRPLSSETLVWLLLAVAYSDSSTTSQAEVPLERIHAFYWEMGPFMTKSANMQNLFLIVQFLKTNQSTNRAKM